jgi:hypothetical protein
VARNGGELGAAGVRRLLQPAAHLLGEAAEELAEMQIGGVEEADHAASPRRAGATVTGSAEGVDEARLLDGGESRVQEAGRREDQRQRLGAGDRDADGVEREQASHAPRHVLDRGGGYRDDADACLLAPELVDRADANPLGQSAAERVDWLCRARRR